MEGGQEAGDQARRLGPPCLGPYIECSPGVLQDIRHLFNLESAFYPLVFT